MGTVQWSLFLLAASVIIPIWYYGEIVRYYPEGCVMDAFSILPEPNVFPVLALIYGLWNMYAVQKDNNALIILLYSDKGRLWDSKCLSITMTAIFSSLLTVIGSMASASLYFKKWCNWREQDSFFMELYRERGIVPIRVLEPVIIAAACVVTFFLLFLLTGMIGLFIEAVTGKLIISILFLAIISGMDSLKNVSGGISVLYSRFQVNRLMWIQPEKFLSNTIVLCLLIFLGYLSGRYFFERRENT